MTAQPSPDVNAAADPEVHHPPHYNAHPSGLECIELAELLPFCSGNALKYVWRAGLKTGVEARTDLQKALWYLDRSDALDYTIEELEERTLKYNQVRLEERARRLVPFVETDFVATFALALIRFHVSSDPRSLVRDRLAAMLP